jgi:hypothetical protein
MDVLHFGHSEIEKDQEKKGLLWYRVKGLPSCMRACWWACSGTQSLYHPHGCCSCRSSHYSLSLCGSGSTVALGLRQILNTPLIYHTAIAWLYRRSVPWVIVFNFFSCGFGVKDIQKKTKITVWPIRPCDPNYNCPCIPAKFLLRILIPKRHWTTVCKL